MLGTDHQNAMLTAWEQELQAQQSNRWFAYLLHKRGETVFQRFSDAYSQLIALPRRTRRVLQRKWATTLAAAALAFALSGVPNINVARAAADIVVDGKNCTLMDAITAANTDTAVGGCVAGESGSDTLILTKDITLNALNNSDLGNSGTPVISSQIVIEGNGHRVKRSGSDPFRIFTVAGGELTLRNTIVSGGHAEVGGGILVQGGGLYMENSTVSENEADTLGGGIAIVGDGEGFSKYSNAFIVSSTIEKNVAGEHGGGIGARYGGFALVLQSTVSGNTAAGFGGGISASDSSFVWTKYSSVTENEAAYGGGLASFGNSFLILGSSTVSGNEALLGGGVLSAESTTNSKYGAFIVNSTIAHNTAENGGGIANVNSQTAAYAATIAGNEANQNGGGIYSSSGQILLDSTIVSGNVAGGDGYEIYNNIGSVSDGTDNLFGHSGLSTSEALVGFTPDSSDFVATSDGNNVQLRDIIDASGSNPRLRDNGGPTQTIALVAGSPAIDGTNGSSGGPFGIDQRGFVRDGNADIGAFEFGSEPLPADCDASLLSLGNGPVSIIHGTPGNDKLKGTPGNDLIIGYGGNDRIEGLGGNDCIIGDEGNDQLYGGEGNDIIWGGTLDNSSIFSSGDRDKLYGNDGDDEMHGGGDKDRVDGNSGNDTMYGDDGDDTMVAHDGDDTMYGGNGRDNMRGDDGNDMMYGEAGDDRLYGRQGDDLLDGGDNNDQLDGSDGTDTCVAGEKLKSCEQ